MSDPEEVGELEAKLTVRLPRDLLEKYTKRAKRNNRSLNGEVRTVLERFVESKEVGIPADPPGQPLAPEEEPRRNIG